MTSAWQHLGLELPIIQAPMAGSQGSALAIAVSNAGGLGSIPCAMLTPDALRRELALLRAGTPNAFNLNFFCHQPPTPDAARELAWREHLAPFYRELGLGPDTPERLAAALAQITDRQGETVPRSGSEQGVLEVGKAMKAHGVLRA